MARAKSSQVEVRGFVLKTELSDAQYLPAFSSLPVPFSPVPSQLTAVSQAAASSS